MSHLICSPHESDTYRDHTGSYTWCCSLYRTQSSGAQKPLSSGGINPEPTTSPLVTLSALPTAQMVRPREDSVTYQTFNSIKTRVTWTRHRVTSKLFQVVKKRVKGLIVSLQPPTRHLKEGVNTVCYNILLSPPITSLFFTLFLLLFIFPLFHCL